MIIQKKIVLINVLVIFIAISALVLIGNKMINNQLQFLPYQKPSSIDEPIVSGKCLVTGCSGQICSDEDIITTCEYKDEYACYKTAKCERQEDGKCGWTPTEDLVSCLGAVFQAE